MDKPSEHKFFIGGDNLQFFLGCANLLEKDRYFKSDKPKVEESSEVVKEERRCKTCTHYALHYNASPCDKCLDHNLWLPKEPIMQKEKKIKLKISEKKLKYLQEIICDKCMKCDEECNEPCNLSRYIKKERE